MWSVIHKSHLTSLNWRIAVSKQDVHNITVNDNDLTKVTEAGTWPCLSFQRPVHCSTRTDTYTPHVIPILNHFTSHPSTHTHLSIQIFSVEFFLLKKYNFIFDFVQKIYLFAQIVSFSFAKYCISLHCWIFTAILRPVDY